MDVCVRLQFIQNNVNGTCSGDGIQPVIKYLPVYKIICSLPQLIQVSPLIEILFVVLAFP